MTNEEILNTPDALLRGLDKQRKFLLRVALQRSPCPVCGKPCNLLEASGVALNDYAFDGKDRRFHCPEPFCAVELTQVVPLMVIGPGNWHWIRKHSANSR
jgi:hypothetical protein